MPNINDLPTGLRVATAIPLDKKTYCPSEAILSDLGTANNLAYTYYLGLVVYCVAEQTRWEWKEVLEATPDKLLVSDFIYPAGVEVYGIDYSNKRFNFVLTTFQGEKGDDGEPGPSGPTEAIVVRRFYSNYVGGSSDIKQTIVEQINDISPNLVLLKNEVLLILSRDWTSDPANPSVYKFILCDKGDIVVGGDVGANATLSKDDLEFLYYGKMNTIEMLPELLLDPNSQIINLGEIGSDSVEVALNEHSSLEIQSQAIGVRIVRTTSSGSSKDYIFLSAAGIYGVGGVVSYATDFQLVNDKAETESIIYPRVLLTDSGNIIFNTMAGGRAYMKQFTDALITDEQYSNGVYSFRVPRNSSFNKTPPPGVNFLSNIQTGLPIGAIVQNGAGLKFEDPSGLFWRVEVGQNNMLRGNTQNNVFGDLQCYSEYFGHSTLGDNTFGNCIFGKNAFGYAYGNNVFKNYIGEDFQFVGARGNNTFKDCQFYSHAFKNAEPSVKNTIYGSLNYNNPSFLGQFAENYLGVLEILGPIGPTFTKDFTGTGFCISGSQCYLRVHAKYKAVGDLDVAQAVANGVHLLES